MKLLIAATGNQPSDFTHTIAGELVYIGPICARDQHGDQGCGCARAFIGLASAKATTVATIADVDTTVLALAEAIGDSMTRAGWHGEHADHLAMANDLVYEAARWPLGTALRRVQPGDGLVPA